MGIDAMPHTANYWVSLLLFHLIYSCFGVGLSPSRGPQFGTTEETVTVQEGETARLPCQVLHLKDRKVTWLRRRDLHILTTGHHTYSADERFQVLHEEGSDLWTLVVRYAQLRDSGIYECQVNTDPKFSRPVTLNVYEVSQPITVSKTKVFVANNTASTKDGDLRVRIQGPREIFMEEGSSLTLTCLVTSLYGPSTLIYWYHDTQLLAHGSPRGGIKMKMDRARGETTSRLTVKTVRIDDSGMYSCVPSGSHPATVRVHVHEGENEAAVQQGGLDESSSCSSPIPLPLIYYLLFSCLYLYNFNQRPQAKHSTNTPVGLYILSCLPFRGFRMKLFTSSSISFLHFLLFLRCYPYLSRVIKKICDVLNSVVVRHFSVKGRVFLIISVVLIVTSVFCAPSPLCILR